MVVLSFIAFGLVIGSLVELALETGTLPEMRRAILMLVAIGLVWSAALAGHEELADGVAAIWLIMLAVARVVMLIHTICWIVNERWATWRDVS